MTVVKLATGKFPFDFLVPMALNYKKVRVVGSPVPKGKVLSSTVKAAILQQIAVIVVGQD